MRCSTGVSAFALVVAFVLVVADVRPAGAVVLAEDEFEETSTVVGAIARAFSFVLTGPILRPPFALVDQDPSGLAIFDMRGYFAHKTRSISLVAHVQLSTTLRAHPAENGLLFGRGVAPPRFFPLRVHMVDEDTVSVLGAVDWLYGSWTHGRWTVTLGRMPITFGRSKLWSPSDVVATFALTEVDTEYKPGADALRVDYSPRSRTSFSLVAVAGEIEYGTDETDLEVSPQGSSVLVRGEQGFDRGEVGALIAVVRGDVVAGADGIIDMGGYELYGEATATLVTSESVEVDAAVPTGVESGDIRAKAVLGATVKPASKVTTSIELSYNGFGAATPDDYLAVAQSPRVAIGEQSTLGRYYAGVVVGWELHPLWNLGGAFLGNLGDQSGLVSLVLSGNLSDNTNLILGGYVGLGQSPERVLLDIEIPDEFGLYPRIFFAELQAAY